MLESALPKCMCARGLGAPSPSPMMLHTACRSKNSRHSTHAELDGCRRGGSSDSFTVLEVDGQHPGDVSGSPGKALSAGRDGARAPQIPGQRPSFLPAVGSCSMYMCNYYPARFSHNRVTCVTRVTR